MLPSIKDEWASEIPFKSYEHVFIVSKIQDFLHRRKALEQDFKGLSVGSTLGVAIDSHRVEVVRFLLEKGADPNGWSYVEFISHLAHAASVKNQEAFQLLLDNGAQPQQSGALWEAAEGGNNNAAEILIDRGVDVNEVIPFDVYEYLNERYESFRTPQLSQFAGRTRRGTPLHAAAKNNQVEMVRFLLSKGANKDLKNLRAETAEDIAATNVGPLESDPESIAEENRRLHILDMLE